MMIAAVMGAMLMSAIPGVTAEARGQSSLTQLWVPPDPNANPLPNLPPREVPFAHHAPDQPVAIGTWYDAVGSETYVYVTGWGTNYFGGAHIVTYRYKQSTGELVDGPVYFPSQSNPYIETIHKPTSMIVERFDGDVYIAGYSENGNGDFDYILLKYDRELVPDWDWPAISPDPAGVRRFDGGHGNDRAIGVALGSRPPPPPQTEWIDIVVITGTSRSESDDDIVTIAYECDTGDVSWEHTYAGYGGNDEAVQLVMFNIAVEQHEEHPGANFFIGATVWNSQSSSFDIQALRYSPEGSLVWCSDPYDGPENGADICTGLAKHGMNLPETPPALFVIGSTPRTPAAANDTDFVTLALRLSDGAYYDLWESVGFGDGVRVWSPGGEKSDDVPVVASFAGLYVWVVGRVKYGEAYDIGVIAYEFLSGDEYCSALFGSEDITTDEQPADCLAFSNGNDGNGLMFTGWVYYPAAQTAPYRYLTYKVGADPPTIGIQGVAEFLGDGLENRATAIHFNPHSGSSLYVTGRSASSAFGLDFVTLRYSP